MTWSALSTPTKQRQNGSRPPMGFHGRSHPPRSWMPRARSTPSSSRLRRRIMLLASTGPLPTDSTSSARSHSLRPSPRRESSKRSCRGAGLALALGFKMRFEPIYMAVHELLRDGVIGQPRSLTATHHQRHPRKIWSAEIGVASELLVHTIDLTRWLLRRRCDLGDGTTDADQRPCASRLPRRHDGQPHQPLAA